MWPGQRIVLHAKLRSTCTKSSPCVRHRAREGTLALVSLAMYQPLILLARSQLSPLRSVLTSALDSLDRVPFGPGQWAWTDLKYVFKRRYMRRGNQ